MQTATMSFSVFEERDPPPSYSIAMSTPSPPPPDRRARFGSHLTVPEPDYNSPVDGMYGVPAGARRSMEDETRRLPTGWVRTYDPETHHQFYVDITKDPPRSIWTHPFDDDEYLASLSEKDKKRVDDESLHRGNSISSQHIIAAESDDEDSPVSATLPSSFAELPPRPDSKDKTGGYRTFGRKWKDRMTGTSHEQRQQQRDMQLVEDQKAYQLHLKIRRAMVEAAKTGKPQYIGKDSDGKEVYVDPLEQPDGSPGGSQIHADSATVRYIRPRQPYNRPNGIGFGGGYGLPLAMGSGGIAGGVIIN